MSKILNDLKQTIIKKVNGERFQIDLCFGYRSA